MYFSKLVKIYKLELMELEINEVVLRFKLNVIQDKELRENAYNYILRIKNMEIKKILDDIGLYIQCKQRETTELKILYAIVLQYLNEEIQFRSLL